jgi:HAD superfamily hydrolase (TIGR01509 family)
MPLKGIIFDVDGTLVDSNDFHAEAWQKAFEHFGKNFPFALVRKQIGKGGDLLVPDLLSGREMRRFGGELREFRKKLFRDHYLDRVRPFPGVSQSVERLHDQDLRIVLASSSDADEVEHYTKLLGIGDFLDGSTSKDDAEFSKPSPEIFEAALERLGLDSDEVVTVGDTPYDVLASHRACLTIVAVLSGGFDKEELGKAEFILDGVRELPERISEIDAHLAE